LGKKGKITSQKQKVLKVIKKGKKLAETSQGQPKGQGGTVKALEKAGN